MLTVVANVNEHSYSEIKCYHLVNYHQNQQRFHLDGLHWIKEQNRWCLVFTHSFQTQIDYKYCIQIMTSLPALDIIDCLIV